MRRILVTSALPYANGHIHIGHLVEYIQTDIYVRFLKLIGTDVIYMCASDAHGTPIEINASKQGITPEELVGRFHEAHQEDFARYEISFDNFYTTDSPENQRHSETIYLRAKEKGHISIRDIEQFFCESCGRFLPDRYIKGTCPRCEAQDQYGDVCEVCGATYSPTDLSDARCSICSASPSVRTSKHFFFRLADFNDFLGRWISEADPKTGRPRLQTEIKGFCQNWIDHGLQDWDISRDGPYFGFKIPGEEDKFFYVWLDAPIGYIAATENYCVSRSDRNVEDYWIDPSADVEIHHFIGKDISYFHTLFWPAMLKAADYRLPNAVHVHGFLTVDGRKMSKSRGTFITARQFAEFVDPSLLRYYYATKLNDSVDDLDLNVEEFVNRINAELVNNITNLISRAVGFLNKRLDSKLGTIPDNALDLVKEIQNTCIPKCRADFEALRYGNAMRQILHISDLANVYIQEQQPWAVIKEDPEKARDVLTFAVNCVKIASILLKAVLPDYCAKVERILGVGDLQWDDATFDLQNREIGTFEKLAERLEPDVMTTLIEASRESLAATQETPTADVPPFGEEIVIEDLAKVDLRAGKILAASTVKGADKLLKLDVDLGPEKREIFAGIKASYDPEDLVGRNVVVVANLKPRKMKFGVSQGMVLAAVGKDGKAVLCEVNQEVPPGTPIS